jgi:mannose-6-phosphate isomerase-like protein (cupin superfamily)
MAVKVVNIKKKLSVFDEYWSPKIVGELNDDKVQVVKLKGKFVWHKHDKEEELFYVIKGKLLIRFRDKTEEIN